MQARSGEVDTNEKVRIYHHELHKKHIKRSSILKLQTDDGMKEGHDKCASYLEAQVGHLLLNPGVLDQVAREAMLREVDKVFTDRDNSKLPSKPSQEEVRKVITKSNVSAAPGSDGIPCLLYDRC